ncbi:tetratricopeptide repeat protein [Aestuariibaculum sp. M13]|uniref:tetratricopeptide repeat protein n=1 Tax=Aestuariibaculum sp. M13 TaxID=2967132 RepID=UPI002159CCA0|nr:tetratricopeptide repeat protein [Aestuariibaculum sp. M13]MCR8668508.1 tetratricopeptide repeat protein [Aestuariibaculum sp. M13]
MKNIYFLLSGIMALSLTSCGTSGYVNLNYPQEPLVILPDNVSNVVLVNRSLTKDEDKNAETMEAITTGEVMGSDRIASDEAMKGVYDGIQNKSHIQIIMPDTLRLYGTGTRLTPELLPWDKVSEICEKSNADVLLVLENFDSNSDLIRSAMVDQVNAVITTGKPSARIPTGARVNVRSYWRLYDPYTKTIIDQFQQTHYMNFDLVNGVAPINALGETAYAAGFDYINRFLPSYYRVKRDMYKKGKGRDKDLFGAGWRSAEVAKWNDAIAAWKRIVDENPRSKSAGRAAHNIAVSYEVLGDTDLALQWAQRAYRDYGDKESRDYAKILLRRQRVEG